MHMHVQMLAEFVGPTDQLQLNSARAIYVLDRKVRSVSRLLFSFTSFCTDSHATNKSMSPNSFAMEGPMVALLMPFKPDTLEIDDTSFVKYLEVGVTGLFTRINFGEANIPQNDSLSWFMQYLWSGGIKNVVVNG